MKTKLLVSLLGLLLAACGPSVRASTIPPVNFDAFEGGYFCKHYGCELYLSKEIPSDMRNYFIGGNMGGRAGEAIVDLDRHGNIEQAILILYISHTQNWSVDEAVKRFSDQVLMQLGESQPLEARQIESLTQRMHSESDTNACSWVVERTGNVYLFAYKPTIGVRHLMINRTNICKTASN
jgi:hypothetical protein